MTQQEILQNMTKGEWHLSHSPVQLSPISRLPFKSIKNSKTIGGRIIANAFGVDLSKISGKQQAEANAAGIVTAVNHWQNLMSKGINPEAVEGLLKLLDKAVLLLSGFHVAYGTGPSSRKELADMKEALNAAKLDSSPVINSHE